MNLDVHLMDQPHGSSDSMGGFGSHDVLEAHPQSERVVQTPQGGWVTRARAKLNLGLRVFPARPDGFHDLETWMVPTSWYDTLTISPGLPLELVVHGRTEGIPTEIDKNLIGRAALKLAAVAGIEPRGRIELHKVLPPGGGLGGGSSDAASALLALNAAWSTGLELRRLVEIAAELGSDVPFFVQGGQALCTGQGEIMTPLRSCHPLFAVLILPAQGLATKPVYQAFDAGHRHADLPKTDWCTCASATAEQLSAMLVNDLEPPAFHLAPWLKDLRDRAASLLGQQVHMTGSGSTLFTLCSSSRKATEIHARLSADLPGDTTCVPVRILRQR